MRKVEAEQVLAKLAETILDQVTRDGIAGRHRGPAAFVGDPEIDKLIKDIKLADWDSAAQAAIKVIAQTDAAGRNEVFESLLNYQDCPDDDERFWGAFHTVESCVRLAPWLIDHAKLSRMAAHPNFSVRSSAASICMDLAHTAPDRVPLDIVLKLSVYDEDWYVEAPANAALKAMARSFPEVVRVFHDRLCSTEPDERAHAASALEDIAKTEPGLLDPQLLLRKLACLRRLGDSTTLGRIRKVISKAKAVARTNRYRYGI